MLRNAVLFLVALCAVMIVACRKDKDGPPVGPPGPTPISPVVFDPAQVPYPNLSMYNFFQGDMAELEPVHGVLPYDVITPLFSDYALKKRFIWMPLGVQGTYAGDDAVLDLPNSTVLIKSFRYENVQPGNGTRHIETRLIFKRNGGWEFANYVWNEEQSEAQLDLTGIFTPVSWTDPSGIQRDVNYRIPSAAECVTCHRKDSEPIPIGLKPQNLSLMRPYADGVMDQLAKWTSVGYLAPGTPSSIDKVARWDDPGAVLDERVRAYLDMNCSHCHSQGSYCDYRPMRFAWTETDDPVNLGICVPPDDILQPALTHIVSRGNLARSMLHYRLSSTDESVRMPLLGRSLVHEEGLDLVEQWINSLSPACE